MQHIKITQKKITFAVCILSLLIAVCVPPMLHRRRMEKQWEQAGISTAYPVLWESHYDEDSVLTYYYRYQYNEAGQMLSKEYYTLKNAEDLVPTLNWRQTYVYDDEGRMLAHISDNITYRTVTRWQYDPQGRMLQKTEQPYGNVQQASFSQTETTICEYAEDGSSAKVTVTQADGSVRQYQESAFDGDGREIHCVCYDNNHVMTWTKDHTYDENGRLVKTDVVYEVGDVTSASGSVYQYQSTGGEWIYDRGGRLLSYAVYQEGRFFFGQTYAYDVHGRLVKLTLQDEDGVTGCYRYIYDKKGRRIERAYYNPEGQMTGQQRYGDFDLHGNPREVIEYKDGRETGRVVRTYGSRPIPQDRPYGNQTGEEEYGEMAAVTNVP